VRASVTAYVRSLSREEARNLIIALYSPKDVTTYGYYFLFSVSSSGIDLGEIPENRENISCRERGNADITPLSFCDFLQFGISLSQALRMNL